MSEKVSPPHSQSPPDPPSLPALAFTHEEYSFIDEIIQFQNEGIQITCYPTFYEKTYNILKKSMLIEGDDIIPTIIVLLIAFYFWIDDYVNETTVFMTEECFKNYDLRGRPKTQKLLKYLCFIIVSGILNEFYSEDDFLQEWNSYSRHKKMLFDKLMMVCYKHLAKGRAKAHVLKTDVSDLSASHPFENYIKNAYLHIGVSGLFPTYHSYYDYAKKQDFKLIDVNFDEPKKANPPADARANARPNPRANAQANPRANAQANPLADTRADARPNPLADTRALSTMAASAVDEDDSGYTMVASTIQIRYLLKSQDYDLIKRDIARISEPICRALHDCTSRFQDRLSGKYLNIFVGSVQVAHFSYYHHSNDVYHFKIDSPAHFRLQPPPVSRQYTVPFNFHINTQMGVITFATRDIDNPATETQCPQQVIDIVRESLGMHLATLHSVVRPKPPKTGKGYKLHKSRRCRRGCKSKRKRTMRRRRRRA
jgi:hypothetical protein